MLVHLQLISLLSPSPHLQQFLSFHLCPVCLFVSASPWQPHCNLKQYVIDDSLRGSDSCSVLALVLLRPTSYLPLLLLLLDSSQLGLEAAFSSPRPRPLAVLLAVISHSRADTPSIIEAKLPSSLRPVSQALPRHHVWLCSNSSAVRRKLHKFWV